MFLRHLEVSKATISSYNWRKSLYRRGGVGAAGAAILQSRCYMQAIDRSEIEEVCVPTRKGVAYVCRLQLQINANKSCKYHKKYAKKIRQRKIDSV